MVENVEIDLDQIKLNFERKKLKKFDVYEKDWHRVDHGGGRCATMTKEKTK